VRSPGQGLLRCTRAGVLVGLTVLVSLGGHVLGGGVVRASAPMVLGVLALAGICVAAAESRRGFGEIFAVVLLAQPVLHLLASMGGHHHGSTAPASGDGLGLTPVMIGAHVLAAAALSVLLACADRLLWAFAALARRVALPPVPTPLLVLRCGPVPLVLVTLPALSALRDAPLRRGPPSVAAAL
jgi:hypothetical protein